MSKLLLFTSCVLMSASALANTYVCNKVSGDHSRMTQSLVMKVSRNAVLIGNTDADLVGSYPFKPSYTPDRSKTYAGWNDYDQYVSINMPINPGPNFRVFVSSQDIDSGAPIKRSVYECQ